MRTTMNIDSELVAKAKQYSGIDQTTALVHEALRRLIHHHASQRLAALGGKYPDAKAPPRKKFGHSAKRQAS